MKNKVPAYAFKTTLPVLFGYITLGIAFGLVLTDANYPWYLALIMSIVMYAGAAQFCAIGLFAAGTPLPAILVTIFLVNIRHIVYGLSLITKFRNTKKWKPYLIFALTDETYSLLTTVDVPENCDSATFYGLVSLFDHCYWVLGSVIGALLGNLIPFDLTGVDFALTALFAVLTVEQILKTRELMPVLTGIITTVITIILWRLNIIKDSSNILLIALCCGIAVLLIFKSKTSKKENKNVTNE